MNEFAPIVDLVVKGGPTVLFMFLWFVERKARMAAEAASNALAVRVVKALQGNKLLDEIVPDPPEAK